jgi:vacuolar-type H+-ATPase catalytic subunit A/Vma1
MDDNLLKIKTIVNLDFEIAKKNAHVFDGTEYWKLNANISYGNLFWLIEQAEKVEQYQKAVNQAIEKMNGYDLHRFGDELQEVLKA